jgi:hypothetical protein
VALKVLCIRQHQTKKRRNQHPESSLWESEVGSDWLKRADDATVATRLFDREFPDLFSWLLDEMNALPLPRKSRGRSIAKSLIFESVPS